jgi:shikimate dehydrogenase
MMKKYGVIGYPAQFSFSPDYFRQKFKEEHINDCVYHYYEIQDLEDLDIIFGMGVRGLNVTSPFKEKVIDYIDTLDASASSIQAVNTIKIEFGKRIGYNTDVYGFQHSILKEKEYITSDKCLVLGSGGAAKAVRHALEELSYNVILVSRQSGAFNYSALTGEFLSGIGLIVNATPLGMHPDLNRFPDIPFEFLNSNHFVYDLIYNPEKTVFLTKAESTGAHIKNGYDMLKFQAEKSWEIWNH